MRSTATRAAAVGLVLSFLVSVSAGESGPPVLENGDFEKDPPGAITIGKLPTGWVKPYGGRVLQIVSETRPGSPGTQCLKIGTSEKVRMGGAYSRLVPLDPQLGLHVSGWVRPGDEGRQLRGLYFGVGWYDKSRRPIIVVKGTTVNYVYLYRKEEKGDWYRMFTSLLPASETRESYGREIPPAAAFFDIRVFALNYQAPAWFDDIEARSLGPGETAQLKQKQEKKRREAARKDARTARESRPPGDLNAEWLVAAKGTPKALEAADELARYLNKVLGKEVSSVEWQPNTARSVFLVTEVSYAPSDMARQLAGKRRDAFAIRYPVEMDGQSVCLLVSQDEDGYDRAVYNFLTRFLNVHWVGPGELGEVYTPRPDWRMPESIEILENPDFEMRHWHSPAFSCRQWLAAGVRMGFHHALGHVFHPDKHGDEPEVYPLVGGRRFIPKPETGPRALSGWQPCTGNPRSVEIAVEHVLAAFAENPRMATVSLSVNDGAGNTCECALCRAQDSKTAFQEGQRPDLSDRFFRFYNAVVERAIEKDPRARVAVLGYGAVKTPPKEVRVHPRISVFHVCPNKEALRAWKEAGANPNLYLWLWDGGFLTVRPDPRPMVELIREAHKLGGTGLYSECIPHWIVSGPKFYVLAHVLWDTSRDPDELLGRYFGLAYGEAAKHVRTYFDRWYEVYRRLPVEEHYRTSWGWRGIDQFEHLRKDDLGFLDTSLEEAAKVELTDKQSRRLRYLRQYHELMRLNGLEYLAGQELSDENWLAGRDASAVLTTAEHTTTLTPRFDELYRRRVLEDETGWMLEKKHQEDPDGFYTSFVAPLRNTVSSNAGTAIDSAIAFVVRRELKERTKPEVIAYLGVEIEKRPALAPFLGPQINKLKGVRHESIVPNGNFEEGEPGDPPTLPGWDFYQFYGMVKGVTARHDWKNGNGRDGTKAIGMGEGRYPEMKTIVEMEAGRRYQLSFWYRSEKRDRNSSFSIFSYDGDLASPRDIEQEKIHRFQVIQLEPTGGSWRHYVQALQPAKTGKYVLQLAVYYQESDWWAWFDDIEIRRLW